MKLDYSIESPEERKELVEAILAEDPNPPAAYLEILADYLILGMEKQEKKEKKILTENRLSTINKRETSFEGLVSTLENGEDGIYNLMSNNKNLLLQPKISITDKDLKEIPLLAQLRSAIIDWEKALKKATGREAYIIKKSLIEMRKEQYLIKNAYRRPIIFNKLQHGAQKPLSLEDTSYVTDDYQIEVQGISLMDPQVVAAIMSNYSKLKEDSYDRFEGDMWWLLQSFEAIADEALKDYPYYKALMEYKIDGKSNQEIQLLLKEEFNQTNSVEYISSLWKNKIPLLIARAAQEDYIIWYYKKNNLPFKKCGRCGQEKPTHNLFFSKNKTTKDSFYSICKCCRNRKR